jgi:hypothetical protein
MTAVIFFTYNYGNTVEFWSGVSVGIFITLFVAASEKRANQQ